MVVEAFVRDSAFKRDRRHVEGRICGVIVSRTRHIPPQDAFSHGSAKE